MKNDARDQLLETYEDVDESDRIAVIDRKYFKDRNLDAQNLVRSPDGNRRIEYKDEETERVNDNLAKRASFNLNELKNRSLPTYNIDKIDDFIEKERQQMLKPVNHRAKDFDIDEDTRLIGFGVLGTKDTRESILSSNNEEIKIAHDAQTSSYLQSEIHNDNPLDSRASIVSINLKELTEKLEEGQKGLSFSNVELDNKGSFDLDDLQKEKIQNQLKIL